MLGIELISPIAVLYGVIWLEGPDAISVHTFIEALSRRS
jgi:hypothetical protein